MDNAFKTEFIAIAVKAPSTAMAKSRIPLRKTLVGEPR
jgi:hypothetical protein